MCDLKCNKAVNIQEADYREKLSSLPMGEAGKAR